jgi:hypothetical protein
MAVQQQRPVEDISTPQLRHYSSEWVCRICLSAGLGARSGAKQAQAEDRAPMSVDAGRRGKHGGFGFKADNPETSHATALATGLCKSMEMGMDRGGAAAECAGIHI